MRVMSRSERIWRHIERSADGCWLWTGAISVNGYGVVGWNRTTYNAHRFAYETFVGPVDPGLQLDHLCRVRHCVNPAHLEPVTHQENAIRGTRARGLDTHCRNGHVRTEASTYRWVDKNGKEKIDCRECSRDRRRRSGR